MPLLAGLLAAALTSAALADPGQPCPKIRLPPIALTHVQKALRAKKEIIVVALGSSSTEGTRASALGRTYPAILQAELADGLPDAHVAVVNRGVGGQDAAEELARIDSDVLAIGPSLVIWQVGANGAMRGSDPAQFKRLVDTGVRKLESAGADVILMDNQRSPAILGSPDHAKLDQALADVATLDGAKLFARGRLMELWQDAGYPYADFLDNDGVHHNDRGYACLARALAATILDGMGRSRSEQLHAAQ